MECSNFSNGLFYIPNQTGALDKYSNRFIDVNKKIVKFTSYDDCFDSTHDRSNYEFSKISDLFSLEDAINFDCKIIAVTYWPPCYGHILESIFHLYDVFDQYIFHDFKIFLYIPEEFSNLIDLSIYLFGDRLFNPAKFPQDKLFHFGNVVLIHNYMNTNNWFQWRNEILREKILSYYLDSQIASFDKVFLTRTSNTYHEKWSTLSNLSDIENFYTLNNFKVINPQLISDKELYNRIKASRIIVTTNGSALCPLIFISNKNRKVFCLNSQRYLPEWRRNLTTIDEFEILVNSNPDLLEDDFEKKLWKPVTSKFDFRYIDSFSNQISLDRLVDTLGPL